MKAIDVQGLPEHVARLLAKQVERLRENMLHQKQAAATVKAGIRPRSLGVKGRLTRSEIYGDDD